MAPKVRQPTSSREFLAELRRFQSRVSIAVSAVRGQGVGTMQISRDFMATTLNLARAREQSIDNP
jgi:hypothetical protein